MKRSQKPPLQMRLSLSSVDIGRQGGLGQTVRSHFLHGDSPVKRLGIALSVFLFPALLAGQETVPSPEPEAAACRALFSTSAGTTEPGVLELEFGGQKIYNRNQSEVLLFPTQLNLGLFDRLDVRLGWGGPMTLKSAEGNSTHGSTDPVFGFQALGLIQDQSGVDLGLAYWHKVPRASVEKGLGSAKHDDTALITLSRAWGRWAVDMNAGANWIGCQGQDYRVRQGVLSCTVTYAPAEGWNLSLDTYAFAGTELGPRVVSSILAASREITPDLTVDVAVEAGLSQSAPRLVLNAGFVWRLGRLWKAGA
jgi:hypothetical protein